MPVPFDSAVCIWVIISQELWRDFEQIYSVNLYIHVLLVTEYESQHHLYQEGQGLCPRRRRVRPLMASQDRTTQTDPEQLGTVAEVDPSSAAVVGQAAAATSTTGDPEVPVPHTAGQQDSGYGSPGQMSEQQRPAEHGAEGQDDGARGQADSAGGQAGGGGL